jgi:hypothetical protein
VTGRRERRRKLDDFKEKKGYWELKEKALNRSLWRGMNLEAMDLF